MTSITALALALVSAAAPPADVIPVFTPGTRTLSDALIAADPARDRAALVGRTLAFDVGDAAPVLGVIEHVERPALSNLLLRGRVELDADAPEDAPGGWFILVVHGRTAAGDLAAPQRGRFVVRAAAPAADAALPRHRVTRVDLAAALDCTAVTPDTPAGPRPGRGALASPPAAVAGGAPLVDVMVLYTPSSRTMVGGTAAIEALIDSFIAYIDQLHDTGNLLHRFRLVHAGEVAYVESGNSLTDLARLRAPADDHMDDVHPLRDAVGADLVSLINTSGSAGVGYQMTDLDVGFEECAFSAIGAVTAPIPEGLVFAHETGHNMGCSHNNGPSPPDALFCDSYGHRTPDNLWRTIMSSSPGTFIDFFSDPDLEFGGFPIGVDGTGCPIDGADNVRTLNASAPTVAMFRPTEIPISCAGDVDEDGAVTFADLIALLAAWGPCPGCLEDLTGDGVVGFVDLLALLAAWGPCS